MLIIPVHVVFPASSSCLPTLNAAKIRKREYIGPLVGAQPDLPQTTLSHKSHAAASVMCPPTNNHSDQYGRTHGDGGKRYVPLVAPLAISVKHYGEFHLSCTIICYFSAISLSGISAAHYAFYLLINPSVSISLVFNRGLTGGGKKLERWHARLGVELDGKCGVNPDAYLVSIVQD
jgi:hypothetical protein